MKRCYSKQPRGGDLIPIIDFLKNISYGFINNSDGIGNFVKDNEDLENLDWQLLYKESNDLVDKCFGSYDEYIESDRDWDLVDQELLRDYTLNGYTHVRWFNR